MIYLLLFWEFFKVGLFTIGGGYAMLPVITDAVVSCGWMTEAELMEFIAIAESTPGPISVNTATLVGMREAGVLGAICATLGVVLPSFIIIYIIVRFFLSSFQKNKIYGYAVRAVNPTVVGLITSVAITLTLQTLQVRSGFDFKALIIIGVLLPLMFIKKPKIPPVVIILLSALLGLLLYSVWI